MATTNGREIRRDEDDWAPALLRDRLSVRSGQDHTLNQQFLEPFVGAGEASRFVQLHPGTVQRLAREGRLPGHPVGDGARRRWRFRLSELGEWLQSRGGSLSH